MRKILLVLIIIFFSYSLKAVEKEKDTLKTYQLGEIIATEKAINSINVASSISNLNYYQIQRTDGISFSEISYYIPSSTIQTNSRGESQLFLRGAGERQLALYFDGVLMNVPWDNRVDLSTIPTDLIGKITVHKGAASVLYGANVIGGAINLNTYERASEGFGFTARAQFADANSQLYTLTGDAKLGGLNYIANISYSKSDGIILPKDIEIGNDSINQIQNSSLRTNTDFNRISSYLRAEYEFNKDFKTAISVNTYNIEKGVQVLTEGAPGDMRYWRYPEIDRQIFTLNNFWQINDIVSSKVVLWYDKFNQTIDSYTDFSYSKLDKKQKDDDATVGLRLILKNDLSSEQSLNLVFNYLNSKHNEIIKDSNEVSNNDFSQNTLSTGVEYKFNPKDFLISLGASYDYNDNPKTGPFIENEGQSYSDYSAFFGLRYFVTEEINLFLNSSRRTRFATMREAFSGALGKFKVNPDLKPETALINELGIQYNRNDLQIELNSFATFYNDLIEQIRLPKEIDSLRRKQRVNYSKAYVIGLELNYSYNFDNSLFSDGYVTFMNSNGKVKNGDELDHLEYKPEIMALINLGYKFDFGFTPVFEMQFIGKQWGKDPDDNWRQLGNNLLFNLRLSYQYSINDLVAECFIRVNNLTDEIYWSKIGLVNPGRTVSAGFVVRY